MNRRNGPSYPVANGRAIAARIAIVLLAIAGCATTSPDSVVRTFYDRYRAEPFNGVPSRDEMAGYRTVLSEKLQGQLLAALEYREQFIRDNPPVVSQDGSAPVIEKPSFIDGSYFTSLFEGLTAFDVLRTVPAGDEWHVTVRFRYGDDATAAEWQDTVVVVREHGRFVIDDVIYGGAGEFNPAGRLSESLSWRE